MKLPMTSIAFAKPLEIASYFEGLHSTLDVMENFLPIQPIVKKL